jgi:hypothetical protein
MNKRPSLAESMRQAVVEEPPPPPARATPPIVQPETAPEQPPAPTVRPPGFYAATREGKKKLTAPVSLAEYKRFKHLVVEIDKNNEGALREAISDLFVKYGKPPMGELEG